MGDDSPESISATMLLAAYRRRELSPVDVVRDAIRRIGDLDPVLNAVRTLPVEEALAAAGESESRWRAGTPRGLEGLPVLVKDLFDTAGTPTSYGSALFDGHVPATDAAAVRTVRAAGGVVLAKTATHEFGWGITTESTRFGPTRNPWGTDRSPGGSSGGSAAGLAAGYAPLALGSDTAGSIRVPAAFCGVLGLKPSFGAVDTAGLRPLVDSLDHAGPMARTVEDLALLWSVLSRKPSVPERDRGAAVVGVLDVSRGPTIAPAVVRACATVSATLAEAGHPTRPVSSSPLIDAYPVLRDTVLTGGLATHRRLGLWPDRAAEYGEDVRARLELAEHLGVGTAEHARVARDAVRRAVSAVFESVDVLLSPVSTVAPTVIGEQGADYRDQVLTHIAPQSLAGLPALVVRAGFDESGLPVGVQLTAPAGHEDRLLAIGARFHRLSAAVQQRRPRLVPRSTPTTTAGG